MSKRSALRLAARYLILAVIVAGGTRGLWAAKAPAETRLLRSVMEVTALTNEPSNAGIPVHFLATVSIYDHLRYSFNVTDGGRYVYVPLNWEKGELPLRPGDIVAVDGFTVVGSVALRVYGKSITLIRHGPAPKPEKVSLAEALQPSRNCAYVESEGQVVLVQPSAHWKAEVDATIIRLRSKDVTLDLSLHAVANVSMRSWLGRRMRFRGTAGGAFNSHGQRYQAVVFVRSLQDLTLIDGTPAPSVVKAVPLPLASVFQFGREMPDLVRTSGVVSYVHPQHGFYIQDGNSGMRIRPAHPVDLAPGDQVEVIGRPEWEAPGQSVLSGALVTPTGQRMSLTSQPYHLNSLGFPATDALLTTWEGIVVDQSSEGWRESLTLRPVRQPNAYELHSFQCVYFRNDSTAHLLNYEPGSRITVQGVLELQWSPSHYQAVSAEMLVRNPQDISLLARPPWESRFPWVEVLGLTALVLFGALAWVWTLRRRVASQTADLKRAVVLAEAANRTKSEFLANVSHEIRTPMNGILGMTEMVLASPLTVDQRSLLETAHGSGQILLTIVNDILDSSKIQAGKMTIENTEFSLLRTISGALSPFGSLAFQKGIELACDLAPGLPDLVMGDPVRTRQIIANLVSNAMKFTESGEVVVSARMIDRPGHEEGGAHEIEISVRDTGIGIPQESQHLLFQSFTQTHSSMARRFGGTGLGLSISLQLAQAMGGRMWVESQSGVGSTFFFTLLLHPSPGGLAIREPETRLAGMRVLVVDDHPTSRSLLARWLNALGMEHRMATSGAGALEILKSGERFDFVIADDHLSEMTGSRFLQMARERGWLRGLREETRSVLLCSGPSPREDCHIGRILLKPVAGFQLVEALADLLDDGSQTRAALAELATNVPRGGREMLRILVAEDNEDSRFLMRMYLKRGGYDAVVVGTGKEAVAAWESGDFSLILMDGQMPEMDGLEATACIRERERGRGHRIPIIAITAYAGESDRERFLSAGMTDYLTKPVAYSDLVEAIERSRQAAPAAA